MNNKGSIFMGITVALIVWIFGMLILPFMLDDVSTFRLDMDCVNASISDVSKLVCVMGDSLIPYFIWTVISLALGFVIWIKQ